MTQESIFAAFEPQAYPYKFAIEVVVARLAGGTPSTENAAEGWFKSRLADKEVKDDLLQAEVAQLMQDRGISADEAIKEAAMMRSLNGFKRTPEGVLYMEGRHAKACIKEAASVAADVGKLKPRGYGLNTRKGVISFVAEHVQVPELVIPIHTEKGVPFTEPSYLDQYFTHTFRGSSIGYSEVIEDACLKFTVETDKEFTEEEWAMVWLTAQRQGLGARRSQGFGVFTVTKFDKIKQSKKKSADLKVA